MKRASRFSDAALLGAETERRAAPVLPKKISRLFSAIEASPQFTSEAFRVAFQGIRRKKLEPF
ncbi:hypothetical protein [Janthinobacterium agaricidamnosum]|uniref:Uncharacterized protein n=1 Tax=Janthinobacterium agaricidamnosum NBRC 102515 = DSM 9628 TaxID=1349767 RepID=W0V3A4_9BURK|nr:hypothetical protein [Janthinobacterium agaricidamnosum]CDG83314.1 hypothetical protein GJA_2683 [Janthinobacterium agaricidamnosum NBRC 102515 = DSM 9628]